MYIIVETASLASLNMYKTTVVCLLSGFVFSTCKSSEDMAPAPQNQVPEWVAGPVTSDMMSYLLAKAPLSNSFTLDASTGGVISHDSIDINIPPGVFQNAAGNQVSGNITLKLQTIRSIAEMIYSGVTTVGRNNELLISAGMFRLEAYDAGNNKLKLAPNASISAIFPSYESSNRVFKGIERNGPNNKVLWDTWDSTGVQKLNSSSLLTGIDSLFKYCNLDRYMNGTSLTDITVLVPAGFTNKNTDCFLQYTDANAAAYIPSNVGLKAFSTHGGYYKVVAGKSVKLICCARKNNKFYYQVKTIAAIVDDQIVTMDNMVEISESNLQSVIAAF